MRNKRGLGSLYKRDNKGKHHPASSKIHGKYYLDYTTHGKRIRICLADDQGKTITTLKEAKKEQLRFVNPLMGLDRKETIQILGEKLKSISDIDEKIIEKNTPSLTLAKAYDEYEKSQNRPRSGSKTLIRYNAVINAFTKWMKVNYPNIKEMRFITTEHAEAYARHLESKDVSPSTFNIHLNNLSMIWAVLNTKANIKNNVWAWNKETRIGIQRKNIKAQTAERRKRPLKPEEMERVIESSDGEYRVLFMLLKYTGQRLVDCVKIEWSNISFSDGVITLTPRKTTKRTGKKVFIPLFPQLEEELKKVKRETKHVLPKLYTTYNRDNSAITKQIRKTFTAAGITAQKETYVDHKRAIVETGSHSFRHSFVTTARLAGISDAAILSITGHTSIEMIDHYTNISFDDIKHISSSMYLSDSNRQPIPDWVVEKLKKATDKNWHSVISDLLKT